MSDTESKREKKTMNWAALGAALVALIGAVSAYLKAQVEPQAQGTYETLVFQVVKIQEDASRNHDDLEKLRQYMVEHDRQQDEKLQAFADAVDSAMTPQPAAPHAAARSRARAVASTASSTPKPPPLASAPTKVDKPALDRTLKEKVRQIEAQ